VGEKAAYHGALALARNGKDVVAECEAGSGAPTAGLAAHDRGRALLGGEVLGGTDGKRMGGEAGKRRLKEGRPIGFGPGGK